MRVLVRSRLRRIRINERGVARLAAEVMRLSGCRRGTELSLLFPGEKMMRRLNREYRGVDAGTDVLAFPQGDAGGRGLFLGDVVISAERALAAARRWRTTLEREILLYIVHGILHLRGYDDSIIGRRERMWKKQNGILGSVMRRGRLNILMRHSRP